MQCYVAVNPKVAGITGEYFADCNIARSSCLSRDPALAKRLWEESERILARLPRGRACTRTEPQRSDRAAA